MSWSPGTLPLVGRTSDLSSLDELLRQAHEGPCQVALIEGEAGIGKSRLAREVTERAAGMKALVGRAAQSGTPVPYRPFAEAPAVQSAEGR